jgi:hypothetical protein
MRRPPSERSRCTNRLWFRVSSRHGWPVLLTEPSSRSSIAPFLSPRQPPRTAAWSNTSTPGRLFSPPNKLNSSRVERSTRYSTSKEYHPCVPVAEEWTRDKHWDDDTTPAGICHWRPPPRGLCWLRPGRVSRWEQDLRFRSGQIRALPRMTYLPRTFAPESFIRKISTGRSKIAKRAGLVLDRAVWSVLTKPPGESCGDCAQWFASVLGFPFMATCLLLTLGLWTLIRARFSFKPPHLEGSASARRRDWW